MDICLWSARKEHSAKDANALVQVRTLCGSVSNMALGWLSAAFALLVWGVTFASTRALLFDFSAMEIQIIRFALAWFVLLVIGVKKRERFHWHGREECLFVAMGLTGIFVYQFLENCAIYYTNASNVAILVSFGPIVTAAFAWIFTKDRTFSLSVVVGSLVAVCGVALVSLNGVLSFNMRPLGDLMALGAMISWGAYSVLIDKANVRGIAPLTAIRKAFGWSLLMMLPLAAWGGTENGFYAIDGSFSVNLDWAENVARFGRVINLVNILFLGVFASALSFIAWSKACATLGVVRTTICLYLEPIIGVGFAAVFLGERPTWTGICGGVIIVVGVLIANGRRQYRCDGKRQG